MFTMSTECKLSTSSEQVTTPSSEGMINHSGSNKCEFSRETKASTQDLNKLSKELGKKDFPDAIKLALVVNVRYEIIKCKLNTSGKIGAVFAC